MKINRLEINQKGVRQDVIGAVGLIVKSAGGIVWNIEIGVIDQQVTCYIPEPPPPQFFQYFTEFFSDEVRIAIPLEQEIALQHPVFDTAQGIDLGLPAIGRAQQFQGGQRGDYFDDGRGIERYFRVYRQRWFLVTDFPDVKAVSAGRDFMALDNKPDGPGQLRCAATGIPPGNEKK